MNNTYHQLADNSADFELAEPLSLSARKRFITGLKHEPGIKFVAFSDYNPCNLKVTYKTSSFSIHTLLDIIRSHNAHVKDPFEDSCNQ